MIAAAQTPSMPTWHAASALGPRSRPAVNTRGPAIASCRVGTPLHEIRSSRFLPRSAERALNSALSRGPGYEPTPIGPRIASDEIRGYYIDFSAKTMSRVAGDLGRLLPVAHVQLALGWWERYLTGESRAVDRFLAILDALESRSDVTDGERRWWQRADVPKYGLFGPWCSALTQGQAASAFVRGFVATDDRRYLTLARESAAPLVVTSANDLVCFTSAGPILEEAPSYPPAHILNGWISALWGIRDLAMVGEDAPVAESLDAGLGCLKLHLPSYDNGWWTRYSLYPHAIEDLAKPIYHRFHIAQLRAMHVATGDAEFGRIADRWGRYERSLPTAMVLLQKAGFAALDSGRRRRLSASAKEGAAPELDR
jgi:heparosan-N-sulfate-glucuronate 5-epimerase